MVFPTSAEVVSEVVRFGMANDSELVVRGGAHSNGGRSSTSGGICIDLSKMRASVVDGAKKTLSVQGRALWGVVDTSLDAYNLVTVGGTINHTGDKCYQGRSRLYIYFKQSIVGGLTLGAAMAGSLLSTACNR